MATSTSCCYLSVQNFINLLDPCVCNMPGGGTLVLSDGTIYIRTVASTPCVLTDFVALGTNLNFKIADNFGNDETINVGDTITFIGENGIQVDVASVDTVNISGLTTFGTTAPTTPTTTDQVNIYVNTSTGAVYFWNPTSATWIGPFSGLTFQNSNTIVWSTPATNTKKADIINAPLGGLTSGVTGESIKKDIVTNSNDNVLSLGNQGTYVPPAQRQIATATVATTNESLPYKAIQLQSGVAKVVNHYHQPVADFYVGVKTGLIVEVFANASATQPNDTLTYLWTASSGTVIAPTDPTGTEIDFAAPGEYTITLKVTNEAGFSHSFSKQIKVARILDVQGASEEVSTIFTSLQNAINWIDTFDAGNSALYTINVWGTTTDVTTIAPNFAKVVFHALGRIAVRVDFTVAGAYKWVGLNHEYGNTHIRLPTSTAININTGCNVEFDGMSIYQPNANGILINSGGTLSIRNCILTFTGSDASGIVCSNSTLTCLYTEFIGRSYNIQATTCAVNIQFCKFVANELNTVYMLACFGTFAHNTVIMSPTVTTVDCYAMHLTPNATRELFIVNNFINMEIDNGSAKALGCISIFNTGTKITIANNVILSRQSGILTSGTDNLSFVLVNNFINAITNAITNSTTVATPYIAASFALFPAYNNVFDGTLVGPITLIVGTGIANTTSDNIQI